LAGYGGGGALGNGPPIDPEKHSCSFNVEHNSRGINASLLSATEVTRRYKLFTFTYRFTN